MPDLLELLLLKEHFLLDDGVVLEQLELPRCVAGVLLRDIEVACPCHADELDQQTP